MAHLAQAQFTAENGAQQIFAEAGLALGTPVLTLDGDLPVEFIMPGDRVVTSGDGAMLPRILLAVLGGQLNKQIAFTLSLSERTIKMHRAALLRALGVETTADAIRLAVEAGF